MRKLLIGISLSVLCAMSDIQPVEAGLRMRDVSLSVGTDGLQPTRLEVGGTGGTYDKIVDQDLHFSATVKARVRGGRPHLHKIFNAHLVIRPPAGSRAGPQDSEFQKQWTYQLLAQNYETRKLDLSPNVILPVWKLRGHRARIIAACNDRGPSALDQTISYSVPVVFNVRAGLLANYVSGSDTATLAIPIVCRALLPPTVGQGFKFEHGDIKVIDIELFRSTFGYNHNPNAGAKCQKLRVLVRLRANRNGAVKFKLWKKVGNAAMTSKETVLEAKHDGSGGFKAEYAEVISVNKQTYVQLKAEELVNPVNKSTPWKMITLTCTSAGGGGFTVGSPQQDPVPPQPPHQVKAEVSLQDLTGKKSCPREGRAIIAFQTNRPDPIPYRIRCTLGGLVEDVAQTAPHSSGGWIAPAIETFTVSQAAMYKCNVALPPGTGSNTTGTYKTVAVAYRDFWCVNRIVEPHPGGITGVRPTGQTSTVGSKVTNPSRCRMEWRTSCQRVPEQKCRKVTKTKCTQMPKSECRNVRTRTCRAKTSLSDAVNSQLHACPKVELQGGSR